MNSCLKEKLLPISLNFVNCLPPYRTSIHNYVDGAQ